MLTLLLWVPGWVGGGGGDTRSPALALPAAMAQTWAAATTGRPQGCFLSFSFLNPQSLKAEQLIYYFLVI